MQPGSDSHQARKSLFRVGIRRGWLELSEIDRALPTGSLTPPERWLLFYSLRAAGVEIRDGRGEVPADPPGDPRTPDARGVPD